MNQFDVEFENFCNEMDQAEVNEDVTLEEYLDIELHTKWFNRLVEDGFIEVN